MTRKYEQRKKKHVNWSCNLKSVFSIILDYNKQIRNRAAVVFELSRQKSFKKFLR